MSPMPIYVVNHSTLVTNHDVYVATLAVNQQLRQHAAPVWGWLPPSVHYVSSEAQAPAGSCVIGVLDNADQAGVLGWHTEDPGGTVYGRVFAEPVLANGGDALTRPLSVSSVLSHETLESAGDQHCNLWADIGTGEEYAVELGDPVESDSYPVVITATSGESATATVSNFVLPSWFDSLALPGQRFDYMGLLTAPFEVRSTGYVIVNSGGTISQKWGEFYPEWRKATKDTATSRTARRVRRHAGV